jgi:signal recognition particle GTPase
MAEELTLDDYARLLGNYERRLPALLPGLPGIDPFHGYAGYSAVPRVRRMISAMTPAERADPGLLDLARWEAVAAEARAEAWEVELLVIEFSQWQTGMRRVAALSWWQRVKLIIGI